MNTRRLLVFASALVTGMSLLSGYAMNAWPPLSVPQLQSLSSEGPMWHENDGSLYDPNGARTSSTATASVQRSYSTQSYSQATPSAEASVTPNRVAGTPGTRDQPGLGPKPSNVRESGATLRRRTASALR
jgi:hypothetical protein